VGKLGGMSEVWTHGTWTVIPGRESDFVRLWGQLGEWTVGAFPGARGTLLRDVGRPNVFISFGPWPNRDTASRWRASAEFQTHIAAIRETLELFEPLLLELVAVKE